MTAGQRFCLYHKTNMPPAQVIQVAQSSIDVGHLLRYGVKAKNILSAGFGPLWLKRRGVEADALPDLGFDALHLADEKFAVEAQAAYGAIALRKVFLKRPEDAVCVASKQSMELLSVTSEDLLQLCAGCPVEAHAVLKQMSSHSALCGVNARTLLDTGIRRNALADCGFTAQGLCATFGCKEEDLSILGF